MLEFLRRMSLGDAFGRSGLLYTFPPIPLVCRIFKKIRNDLVQAILVAPYWAWQKWYPELLSMSIGPLIRLPL